MPATTSRTLVYVDREGKEEPLSFRPDFYHDPRVSHDGMRIALTISRKSNQDIWIGDLETGILTPLTSDEAINNTPLWSPDDRWIDFASVRTENMSVYRKASDGTAEVKLLASMSNYGILPWSWSADGNSLLMQAITLSPIKVDIGIFTMEGDQSTKLLFKEKYHEKCPKISPDGRLMAYTSNESGQNEVWIRPFPNVNRGRWMVSKGGGISPLWSPDGKELFYRSNESVMAVTVKMDPNFNHGTPTELFRGKYYSFNLLEVEFDQWDMSSDGKRFLMIKNEAPTTSSAGNPRKINIVVNWLEELKERVPAD